MESLPKTQDVSPVAASNVSEKELIGGLREKADWAYQELISRWSDKLYRFSLRFLKRPEEAQEIVQEVCLLDPEFKENLFEFLVQRAGGME